MPPSIKTFPRRCPSDAIVLWYDDSDLLDDNNHHKHDLMAPRVPICSRRIAGESELDPVATPSKQSGGATQVVLTVADQDSLTEATGRGWVGVLHWLLLSIIVFAILYTFSILVQWARANPQLLIV